MEAETQVPAAQSGNIVRKGRADRYLPFLAKCAPIRSRRFRDRREGILFPVPKGGIVF